MAVDAGFLDSTVAAESLLESAVEQARQLSALAHPAFRDTKRREREATVNLIRANLKEDIAAIAGWQG
jgi:hypothetical protein